MIMGTGSDVGKSLIVAGLCRHFANGGYRVAPFKPQNMSNNAAVTEDGGEIGRAQALQARAARCAMTVDLNPVLLKPQSDIGAQIVLQGRVIGSARAREFQDRKRALMPAVLESFGRLKAAYDLIFVEGAGSASEINLRANDIANMGFAEAAGVPVILVGDIDRGGVIASLVGTKHVVAPADAARIEGFIVNKMRGDPTLFADGMTAIAKMTGWRPLGLVPFFAGASKLPAEDALGLQHSSQPSPNGSALAFSSLLAGVRTGPDGRADPAAAVDRTPTVLRREEQGQRRKLKIAVPLLPFISNFDDLDPLRLEPGVTVELIPTHTPLPLDADVILLPGSKATIADLEAFRGAGWDSDLSAHIRRGGSVLGLCGGFQMLGRSIADPDGIEGPSRSAEGLGYLDFETVLRGEKALRRVKGAALGAPFEGYEMHVGISEGDALGQPFLQFEDGPPDGAVSADGRIAGCYVHGIFASDAFRRAWLARFDDCVSGGEDVPPYGVDRDKASGNLLAYDALIEQTLDELAAHLAQHIDMEALLRIAQ